MKTLQKGYLVQDSMSVTRELHKVRSVKLYILLKTHVYFARNFWLQIEYLYILWSYLWSNVPLFSYKSRYVSQQTGNVNLKFKFKFYTILSSMLLPPGDFKCNLLPTSYTNVYVINFEIYHK